MCMSVEFSFLVCKQHYVVKGEILLSSLALNLHNIFFYVLRDNHFRSITRFGGLLIHCVEVHNLLKRFAVSK